MPQLLKKVPAALRNANLVLGLWAVVLVVLVNAYKGIVTSKLTSVHRVTREYLTVMDMDGFTVYYGKNFDDRL